MNEIKLSINLVNGILQYLGSRPFVEVSGIIQAINEEAAKQMPQQSDQPPAE